MMCVTSVSLWRDDEEILRACFDDTWFWTFPCHKKNLEINFLHETSIRACALLIVEIRKHGHEDDFKWSSLFVQLWKQFASVYALFLPNGRSVMIAIGYQVIKFFFCIEGSGDWSLGCITAIGWLERLKVDSKFLSASLKWLLWPLLRTIYITVF